MTPALSIDVQRLQEKFAISDTTELAKVFAETSSPVTMRKVVDFVCWYFSCREPQTVLPIVAQWVSMMLSCPNSKNWENSVVQWIQLAGSKLDISKAEDAAGVLLGIWPEIRIALMKPEDSIVAMRCICKLNEAGIGRIIDKPKFFKIAQGCESGSRLNQAVDALITLHQGGILIRDGNKLLEALLPLDEKSMTQIVERVIELHKANFVFFETNWRDLFRVLLEFSNIELAYVAQVKGAIGLIRDELEFLKMVQTYKNDPKLKQAADGLIALRQSGVCLYNKYELFKILLSFEETSLTQIVERLIRLRAASFVFSNPNWRELFPFLLELTSTELDRVVQIRLKLRGVAIWISDEIHFLKIVQAYKNGLQLDQAIDALIALKQGGIFICDGGKPLEVLLSFGKESITKMLRLMPGLHKAGFFFFNTNWEELFQFLSEFSDTELDLAAQIKPIGLRGDMLEFLKGVQSCKNDAKLRQAADALIRLRQNGIWLSDEGKLFNALLPLDEKKLTQMVEQMIKLHIAGFVFSGANWNELFQILSELNSTELDHVAKLKLKLKTVGLFPRLELEFLELFQRYKNGFKLDRAIDALTTLMQGGVDIHNAGNLLNALLALEENSITQIVERVITKHKENSRCSENDWRELFQSLQG